MYIVLDISQRDFFIDFKNQFADVLKGRAVDVQPIEIKNGFFILPACVLDDENYKELKQALQDGGHLAKITVREVLPEEFIVPEA